MSGCPLEVRTIFMFLRLLRNTRKGLVKIMKRPLTILTIRILNLFGIYLMANRCIVCEVSLVFILFVLHVRCGSLPRGNQPTEISHYLFDYNQN